jgi:hypothetical protein
MAKTRTKNRYHQGFFTPNNPKKYYGELTEIVYRSSWELRAMKWFDQNPSIVKWNSEGCVIPYFCPTDGKMHRYFIDFAVQSQRRDGTKQIILVEIKPASQRVPPKYSGRQTKSYKAACLTFLKNKAKWAAAEAYCAERGWQFVILDEYDLGIKPRPLNG